MAGHSVSLGLDSGGIGDNDALNIITVLLMVFLIAGLILGAGISFIWRKLRRMGAIYAIEVDPSTHQWQDSWRKPAGSFLKMKRGKQVGSAPVLQENVWSHRTTGRPMVLVDGDKAVSVDVQKQELVWPTGHRLRQIINSEIPRKFDEESSIPWGLIATMGLIGLVMIIGMLGYVITKVGQSGGS